jgi:hypothetical protein
MPDSTTLLRPDRHRVSTHCRGGVMTIMNFFAWLGQVFTDFEPRPALNRRLPRLPRLVCKRCGAPWAGGPELLCADCEEL